MSTHLPAPPSGNPPGGLDRPRAPALRPVIVSNDLDRLLAFCTGLLGAREVLRFPDDGPTSCGQRVAHIEDPDGNVVNLTQQL